jgi:hypothetical protein
MKIHFAALALVLLSAQAYSGSLPVGANVLCAGMDYPSKLRIQVTGEDAARIYYSNNSAAADQGLGELYYIGDESTVFLFKPGTQQLLLEIQMSADLKQATISLDGQSVYDTFSCVVL